MKAARAGSLGPSKAIEKYMDRKISSLDYFREVRKETAREVERDLKEPSKSTNGRQ